MFRDLFLSATVFMEHVSVLSAERLRGIRPEFFIKQRLRFPIDMARNDFKFRRIFFLWLFVFVIKTHGVFITAGSTRVS
jgi:hypothetical protein